MLIQELQMNVGLEILHEEVMLTHLSLSSFTFVFKLQLLKH